MKDEHESKKGSYGIYIKADVDTYKLHKGGFSNTLECKRWIKKHLDESICKEGKTLSIMSKRKEFIPDLKVKKTVLLEEID